MRYRKLGKTGLEVSEIGFGAWGIGGTMWLGGDDGEARAALEAAVEAGLNFLDTALAYGEGHSERLIGRLARERRETLYVATKVPPRNHLWPAQSGVPVREVFPADHLRRSAERSADNLGRPVDLLQFHVWRDEWLGERGWRAVERALENLLSAGTVRAVGISVNDHESESVLEAVARWDLLASVQVIYNIFDQSPAEELFPRCTANDIGVIARVPLDEGGLTGAITPETRFPKGDWRERYFRGRRKAEVAERVERLAPVLLREARSLAEGALRFCLSHPAVSTVIPGMRTVPHAVADCAVSDGRVLSRELLEELKQHEWRRNFYEEEAEP